MSGSNELESRKSKYRILEVDKLANIKSAKKRILVNETKLLETKQSSLK